MKLNSAKYETVRTDSFFLKTKHKKIVYTRVPYITCTNWYTYKTFNIYFQNI